MTRDEIIDAYKRQVPVIFEYDEGIFFRYRRIHGYEVRRGENGREEFSVILFDEEPRKRITIAAPEKIRTIPQSTSLTALPSVPLLSVGHFPQRGNQPFA